MRMTIVPFVAVATSGGAAVETIDNLNVTIPYNKVIELASASIVDVCVNVIEYVPGANINALSLGFNNGDATSFNANSNLVFDGVMKVKNTFIYAITENAGTPSVFESASVVIANFVTIDVLVFGASLTVTAYVGGHTATPTSYINLAGIDKVKSISVAANQGVGAILKYAVDFGGGLVAWNGTAWVSVTNISTGGMNLTAINALTSQQIEAGRNNSTQLKVVYYIDATDSVKVANNDSIVVQVQLVAEPAFSSDYTLALNNLTNELTISFTKNGNYRINYIGGA